MTRIEYPTDGVDIESVHKDFLTVIRHLYEEDYQVPSAKSTEFGYSDQSFIEHVTNGAEVLFSIYRALSDDHPLYDEEHIRQTIACYIAHDYHKVLKKDASFDITKDEAVEFGEEIKLWTIQPQLDADLLQGIMCGHHAGSDDKRVGMIPPTGSFDTYYLVTAADAIAGMESITQVRSSRNHEKYLKKVFNREGFTVRTIRYHGNDGDEYANTVLHAAALELEEQFGWTPLRTFSDGIAFLARKEDTIASYDDLGQAIYQRFKTLLRDRNLTYATSTLHSKSMSIRSTASQTFQISISDVFFQGLVPTLHGIFQQSIALGEQKANSPIKNEVEDRVQKHVAPYVETEIEISEDSDRRVSSLARGVKAVCELITVGLDKHDYDWSEGNWSDHVWATAKLFGVLNSERWKELQQLREENGEMLSAGGAHGRWWYKFLIAQYVFEDYYAGSGDVPSTISKNITEAILRNMPHPDAQSMPDPDAEVGIDNPPAVAQALEDMYIEDYDLEARARLLENLEVDTTILAHEDGFSSSVISTFEEKADTHCMRCDSYMITERRHGRVVHPLFKNPSESNPPMDIQIQDYMGISRNLVSDGTVCIPCQIEATIRHSQNEEWGSIDQIEAEDNDIDKPSETVDYLYAYTDPSYGYVAHSSWLFSLLARDCVTAEHGYNPRPLLDALRNDALPDAIDNLKDWIHTENKKHLTDPLGGLEPATRFTGAGIPVCPITDSSAVFDSITALSLIAAYSGVGVHFTTHPMQSNPSTNQTELITFGDDVNPYLDFYDGDGIDIDTLPSLLERANAIYELTEPVCGGDMNNYERFAQFADMYEIPATYVYNTLDKSVSTLGFEDEQSVIEGLDAKYHGDTVPEELVSLTEEVTVQLNMFTADKVMPYDVLNSCVERLQSGEAAETIAQEAVAAHTLNQDRRAIHDVAEQQLANWLTEVAKNGEGFNRVSDQLKAVSDTRCQWMHS